MPGTWQAPGVWELLTACLCLHCWWSASGWGPVSSCDPASPCSLCSLVAIRRPELGLWKQQRPSRHLPRVPLVDGRCGRLASSSGLPCHWKLASLRGGVEIVISELLVVGKQVLGGRGWVLSSLFPLPPGFIGCPLCPPRQLKTRT